MKGKSVPKVFAQFLFDESGATAIEYALLASLIAMAIVGAVAAVGPNLAAAYQKVSNSF